jgi:hypothetical protein
MLADLAIPVPADLHLERTLGACRGPPHLADPD